MIRAVLFDFDGTLTRPGSIDLKALRGLIGCPPGSVIIEFIEALAPAGKRMEALRVLEEFELAGARRSVPNSGAEDLVVLLRDRGIPRGILTNNCRASVEEAMKNFSRISLSDFTVVLCRENSPRPKPHPDGLQMAARTLGVSPHELLVVGDFVFDIEAGRRGGAVTALLTNGGPTPEMGVSADYVVGYLAEVGGILGF
jgi:hydrogenase expression/formation protein HypE